MAKLTRRQALQSLGALAVAPGLKGCGDEEYPSGPALSDRVDTVVVLMMENRSFDHAFGALTLEGRGDIDGIRPELSNPDAAGNPVLVRPATIDCIDDPPHSWNGSHRQFNDGRNDGFVTTYAERVGAEAGPGVMGYLARDRQPISYALADRYALSDRWFASLMTSTWPNRFYSMAAQNGGVRTNEFEADYSFLNVLDRMVAAQKSMGFYFGNISFASLFPRRYPDDTFRDLERFYDDAAAGTLPNLTWIEPIYGLNDDHPPAHPLAGQVLISTIYQALASSPQWGRCLFIVTYDEHGGFYDHVVPPKAPDQRAADGFDQLGFRVPNLVVGPYAKERYASHQVMDHTSILSTLWKLWVLRPLTMRDAAAADVTELLDPARIAEGRPASPIVLPTLEVSEDVLYAPACIAGAGLLTGGSSSGQPELEAFLDAHPGHPGDRRRHAEANLEMIYRHAEKRGLLRRRSRGY